MGHGPGTVIVFPMFDDARASDGGFPQGDDGCATEETRGPTATGDQLLVADHIWPVRPVTALVHVEAARPHPVDITLLELAPNTPETIADIIVSLNDMFLHTSQVAGVIYPSDIYTAILVTPGVLTFAVSSPTLPVHAGPGELPVMGILTTP
jgi:uncharacterized phage protein gp47/JayE